LPLTLRLIFGLSEKTKLKQVLSAVFAQKTQNNIMFFAFCPETAMQSAKPYQIA